MGARPCRTGRPRANRRFEDRPVTLAENGNASDVLPRETDVRRNSALLRTVALPQHYPIREPRIGSVRPGGDNVGRLALRGASDAAENSAAMFARRIICCWVVPAIRVIP